LLRSVCVFVYTSSVCTYAFSLVIYKEFFFFVSVQEEICEKEKNT